MTYVKYRPPQPGESVLKSDASDPSAYEKEEAELVTATKTYPHAARVWFDLADFYERSRRYADAAQAYQRMQVEIMGLPDGAQFTAGHYHMGRIYTLLEDYPRALEHFGRLFELKPEDHTQASAFSHFREAHYLVGAIYFKHREWELAEQHLLEFKELGGRFRADRMLMDLRYKRKTSGTGSAG